MLYNGENPIIKVIDARSMVWEAGCFNIPPRNHSAIAFRVKGDAIITCNGITHSVNANDILYIPQNTPYTAEYGETEIVVIHFITENDDKNAEVYKLTSSEEIYKLFLQCCSLWEKKDIGYKLLCMANLYKILGIISKNETKEYLPPHFLKAVSFINENYKDPTISVPLICKASGLCETHFRKLFKKYYSKTPTEYITLLRIDQAKNLISGGTSIEETATLCGFNDSKYFARVVKKSLGCTPSDLKYFGK